MPQDTETTRSQEYYVDRLQKRLDAAYLIASRRFSAIVFYLPLHKF